jgi:hypothetical protein
MAQMTSKSQQKRIAMMKEGEKVREWWINPRSERAVNPMFDGWHEAYTQATTNCIHVIEASAYQKLQGENARLAAKLKEAERVIENTYHQRYNAWLEVHEYLQKHKHPSGSDE